MRYRRGRREALFLAGSYCEVRGPFGETGSKLILVAALYRSKRLVGRERGRANDTSPSAHVFTGVLDQVRTRRRPGTGRTGTVVSRYLPISSCAFLMIF